MWPNLRPELDQYYNSMLFWMSHSTVTVTSLYRGFKLK